MNRKEALRKKAKGKKGFTLVELVIVIAVLAIIAAIAIPTVTNVIGNANASADASNAQSVELAIKTAQAECAAYNTNHSIKVETMGLADSSTHTFKKDATVTLKLLLNSYGVDETIISKPKVADNKFVYDSATGKVTLSTSPAEGAHVLDAASTTFKLGTDGSLTIS